MNHISNNSQTDQITGYRRCRLLRYTLSLISCFLIAIPFSATARQAVDEVTPPRQDQTPSIHKEVRNNFNATLKDITGDVLVFQGEKYVPATENMRLKNGARIMAMRNSSAMIYYDNRCKQAVKASSISDVDSAKNSLDCPIVKLTEQSLAQPPAIQAPPAPLPPGPVPVAIPPTPIPPVPPPIPAVNPGLIATIVLPLILLDDDDDDAIRAVSP